jgi:RNA polymerase sigma-70 factor (ECF subfamily)
MEDGFEGREQALVKRALDDPLAFQELYEHYFSRIYGYVASRINNQQDTEDVVSEVFLRVIQNLAALRNQHSTSFAAWLFAIARNAITDHYRRKEHTETVIPFDSHSSLTTYSGITPDVNLIGSEEAAQLRDLIATLPERKREVVMLKYYGGLRNQEIAVVLQIGEKTVAAYLSRALDELHEKYTHLKSEPEQKVVGHDS